MTNSPVLTISDPNQAFRIQIDASKFALDAVVLQKGSDGVLLRRLSQSFQPTSGTQLPCPKDRALGSARLSGEIATFHCWNARSRPQGAAILDKLEESREKVSPTMFKSSVNTTSKFPTQLNIVGDTFARRADLQISFTTGSNDFIRSVRDSSVENPCFKDIYLHLTDPKGIPNH